MIIVIIAGGSGTRLWPLSTSGYPKHLLKLNSDERSLLQHSYDRACQLTDKIYVVSDRSHIDHVRGQLPELSAESFIVEPARRGTANCIIAALVQIGRKHDKSEVIASIPADHYIRDAEGFAHSFRVASEASGSNGRLVLVGVEPDYAATGFGYIEKGAIFDEGNFIYNVSSFQEKPAFDVANSFLESGKYLWNCGYFVGSINTFLDKMQQYAPNLLYNYTKLDTATTDNYEQTYLGLEGRAIDYELIEKVQDLLVVPASFDWMDLGSYEDLHKAVGGNEQGNHVHGKVEIEEVQNSFIQNHEDKPLAVIGLDNVVVVNTPDGILVARKDQVQKIGDISKRLEAE